MIYWVAWPQGLIGVNKGYCDLLGGVAVEAEAEIMFLVKINGKHQLL